VREAYPDVYTPATLAALDALAPHDRRRRQLMSLRIARRRERLEGRRPLAFLDPDARIPGTDLLVRDARAGNFEGSDIPADLRRQWIQGTGPATKPRASTEAGLRSVAFALLSGADGWMFDGEDALGQVGTMSLDNQRNLKLAIGKDPLFLRVAEHVADEMNAWARGFLGRPIVADWRRQLDVTTRIFRPRGLHLDDRHVREADGTGFSASLADLVLYVVNNAGPLRAEARSIVLYLPKIQTAEEAVLWNDVLAALEAHVGLPPGTIKVYVLVEQVEACFQLMEIRAALGRHFVGFNTGRWDYINSVADALAGDPAFVNPDIDAIGMTFGYMRAYEDRVRRAVNTPDRDGRCAIWQGGMEANIPVGSAAGVAAGMAKAVAGAEREQRAGASGKWVAHWKMVGIVRPVWEKVGQDNQVGRAFPPLGYTTEDAEGLRLLEPAPRTVRGARDLLSVGLQYGNAFLRGFQAAALKPADFFGDDDVLYLMEDMATGEIRLSILWEWLAKGARFTEDDPATGVRAGDALTPGLLARLLEEEHAKLLRARDRDVHDDSKRLTLPLARAIVEAYVTAPVKPPWYVDLLNLNLDHHDLATARQRVAAHLDAFRRDGTRLTENLDFATPARAARPPEDAP
jgi:malate synthase